MRSLFIGLLMALGTAHVHAAEITGEYVRAITHTIRVPVGGSLEEGLALSNEWRQMVLDKNPHIASITYLGRPVSDTEYKLLVLYEYTPADAAAQAGQMIGEIMAGAWPGDDGAQAFLDRLNHYISPAENVSHRYTTIPRD